MLVYGLPIQETVLDHLSSWNQAVLFHFTIKAFYSNASMQCNSVYTVNKQDGNQGASYHREEYKQGFHLEEVRRLLMQNIDSSVENNPLIFYMNYLIDHIDSVSQFGDGPVDITKFKISVENKKSFGQEFNIDLLDYFNMCGDFVKTQALWWKSNLLRTVKSKSIDKVMFNLKSCRSP